MRCAPEVVLSDAERDILERHVRSQRTTVRLAERSRIVLLAASGMQDKEIGERLGISRQKAGRWRKRYLELGLRGIEIDAPRSGRPATVRRKRTVSQIIKLTTHSTPEAATHWSTRSMAKHVGISHSTVMRIWHENGLKPHLTKTFKLSNDPQFEEKLHDIVGLYMNPPAHAVVLCVDEKSQIQALDRTQPSLPIFKGRAGTLTHDYKRNGTTSLFAAMNTVDGSILSRCAARHTTDQWIRFLNQIDRSTEPGLDIHIVCDNYCTHKCKRTKRWMDRHKRFHFHFTPTSASWLNMVERFFRDLTTRRLKRGAFQSVPQLEQAIIEFIEVHNQEPKPFIWTKSARDILEKVKRARVKLNKLQEG